MRLRSWGVAAVAVLAATTLAGCRTNVGAAATVDGQRISESTVNDYLTPTGPSSAALSSTATLPRPTVLTILIEERLFEFTLGKTGGVPNAGQLGSVHDAAIETIAQPTDGVAGFDAKQKAMLAADGLRGSFFARQIRTLELEYELALRLHATGPADIAAKADKLGATVSVNPRYGQWDRDDLVIKSGADVPPGFLTLQPTPSPSPTAVPSG